MDDVAAMCDAGVSSSYHRHNDDLHQQQQQQQLIDNPAACNDWMTSSSVHQHPRQQQVSGNIRPLPSCSYRPGTHHALSAADSTTAGPSSTSDTLVNKPDVRLYSLSNILRTHAKFTADFDIAAYSCSWNCSPTERIKEKHRKNILKTVKHSKTCFSLI